ncbi:MAG: peptidase dimerization domain-containing protein, partial [Phycisphaerae bacterium]
MRCAAAWSGVAALVLSALAGGGCRPAGTPSDLFTPPTLNVGAIHAGTVPNMVPGRCEALVDIRYLPETG